MASVYVNRFVAVELVKLLVDAGVAFSFERDSSGNGHRSCCVTVGDSRTDVLTRAADMAAVRSLRAAGGRA